MKISRVFVGLFISSLCVGMTKTDEQTRREAQIELLHLYGTMAVACNAAWNDFGDETGNDAGGFASDLAFFMTKDAAGLPATTHALDAAFAAVWEGARMAALGNGESAREGRAAAEASWEYVLNHENEIKAGINSSLANLQLPDANLLNWQNILKDSDIDTRENAILPRVQFSDEGLSWQRFLERNPNFGGNLGSSNMIPAARNFYRAKISRIKELAGFQPEGTNSSQEKQD